VKITETVAQLDQVRGVLFVRANVGEEFLAPVSSIALHHALAARNIATPVMALLEQLESLRDIQDLPKGHWLPAPTRAVPVGECALVVSGTPSEFLRSDHGLKLFGRGLGRLTELHSGVNLPKESLHTWLNSPKSTLQWCEELIRSIHWGDPFGWRDLTAFDHWTRRPTRRWLPPNSSRIPDGVVFARAEHSTGQRDHYLLRIRQGVADQLAELSSADEAYRVRLALLARAGNPVEFAISESEGEAEVTTWFLPRDETRLLKALGPIDSAEGHLTSIVPAAAALTVQDMLINLGLRERNTARGR
jgi:hypothetical protein